MAHGCFISLRGTWCYQEKSAGLASSGELHSVDLGSGKTDSVLSGASVRDYDISRDEKEVAFTTMESDGESQIWLASLDRRKPPRQIARAGDQVSFGADGDLVFRSLEEKTNWLVRIKKDGREREKITTRRSWKSSAFRPTVNGRSYSHLGLARMPRTCNARSAHPRWRFQENLCPRLLVRVVFRREILLCGERCEGVRELPGKDARDSCASRQIIAGFARFWNRLVCQRDCPPGYPVDRAWFNLARA
jgi:hypothetical protein